MVEERPAVELDGLDSGCREFRLSRGVGTGLGPSDYGGPALGIDGCTRGGKAGDCGG